MLNMIGAINSRRLAGNDIQSIGNVFVCWLLYRHQDYSYWTRTKPMCHMTVSGLLLSLLVYEDGCMITHCMARTENIYILLLLKNL